MKKCKNILLYFVALITILIIIILLAVRFIFWRDDTDNSDTVINEVTVDYYDLEDKLELKDSSIYKTDIQQELEKYGNYSSSVLRFQNNLIYGNYLSKELMNIVMLTKGVWIYDVISKDFDYYEYPDGYRIWDFYVLNDYIYYIKLELDFESDLYMWEFIKSDLNFENKINIDKPTASALLTAMRDYTFFMNVVDLFMSNCKISKRNLRAKVDNYLWLAGMMKYRKGSNVAQDYKN